MAYFKINKDSNTGVLIKEVLNRCEIVSEKSTKFKEAVGATKAYSSTNTLASLIGVGFDSDKEIDRRVWKVVQKHPAIYAPKVKSDLIKEFNEIGEVLRSDLDELVGCNSFFSHVGFNEVDDYYLIDMNLKSYLGEDSVPNEDMTEILESEYIELQASTKEVEK